MRRENELNQPQTFCQKCRRFVRTPNYLIHEARCRGAEMSQSHFSNQSLNTSNFRREPLFSSNFRNRQRQQPEERIPCHFCGYNQTLAELDSHPLQCQHREKQCQRCKGKYPSSLMQQHMAVCPANQRRQLSRPYYEIPELSPFEPQRRRPQNIQQDYRRPQILGEQFIQPQVRPNREHTLFQMIDHLNQYRHQRHDLGVLINLLARSSLGHINQGLSQEQIQSFPVTKYRSKEGQQPQLCTICYCNFEQNQDQLTLPCKHIYHPQCIAQWLKKNDKCPVCKQSTRRQGSQRPPQPQGRGQVRGFIVRF